MTKHFQPSEFACPHCHEVFVRPRLLELLEPVRAHVGGPVRIVSGYRCPVHNRAVGGAKESQHVMAAAADIPHGLIDPKTAHNLGAVGVGVKDGYAIHVDVRDGAQTQWHY